MQYPKHWSRGNIRRFAQMRTGHTPSRSRAEYWQNATVPWFTLADVWQLRDGRRIYLGETENQISELGLANSSAELLPAGTVVLSRTASVGFSGIMPKPMATSQDFWNWVCGDRLIPGYLNYQFKSMASEFRELSMGSTHKTIYQKDAAGIDILVPPVGEQGVIVSFLDRETARIDMLIAKQEQLIAMLRERRSSVISNAIDNFDQKIPFRRILSQLRQGWSPNCEGRPADGVHEWAILKVGCTNSGKFDASENKALPETVEPRSEFAVRRGEIVMSRSNTKELVGSAAVVDGDYPRLLLSDLNYGISLHGAVDPFFVSYALGTPRLRSQISAASKGTSPSMQKISQRDIKELMFSVPPLAEQRATVSYLDDQTAKIDTLIAKAEQFIALSKERRSALITAAVTGQIDVREMAS